MGVLEGGVFLGVFCEIKRFGTKIADASYMPSK